MMEAAKMLQLPMAGEYLGNGGRLYVDRGGHPEYATPECQSIVELITHELAGDRLVRDLANVMNRGDSAIRLHVYKNNVDSFGHTYGGHENYLISARGMETIARLIPFLVTRQIYAGAGKFMSGDRDGRSGYQISQRADFFNCTYSDRTSEVRGIINIRKREISCAHQDRRLHLIIGDSNMAQYALGLKIGTLVLMLRLLEEGALCAGFELVSPAAALKAVSRDLNAGLKVRRRGRHAVYTALEIQSICLERALEFYAANPVNEEEKQWLEMWSQVLQGLKGLHVCLPHAVIEKDDADLKRKIDWVLKLWLLDRGRSRGADENQLKSLDFRYHDLNPASGLYEKCLALDMVDRLISEKAVTEARRQPPMDTRACLRGRVIRQTFTTNVAVEMENWERIHIRARRVDPKARHCFNQIKSAVNSMEIRMEDPFRAHDPQVMSELRTFIRRWG
jgi:proteasome accessory factor A